MYSEISGGEVVVGVVIYPCVHACVSGGEGLAASGRRGGSAWNHHCGCGYRGSSKSSLAFPCAGC